MDIVFNTVFKTVISRKLGKVQNRIIILKTILTHVCTYRYICTHAIAYIYININIYTYIYVYIVLKLVVYIANHG